jgi:hypothetical protein
MQAGGEGWFRFLDHGPFPKKCPKADIGDSFVTGSKGVRFAVMDSAAIAKDEDDLDGEDDVSSGDVENPDALLQQKFEKIAGKLDAPTWLLSHAPFNAVRLNKGADTDEVDDTIQQRALGGKRLTIWHGPVCTSRQEGRRLHGRPAKTVAISSLHLSSGKSSFCSVGGSVESSG